jgi:hypothetical protein
MIVRNVPEEWQYLGLGWETLLKSGCRIHRNGAIAQLGERIVRNDEVVGSSPTSSTKSFNHLRMGSFRGDP